MKSASEQLRKLAPNISKINSILFTDAQIKRIDDDSLYNLGHDAFNDLVGIDDRFLIFEDLFSERMKGFQRELQTQEVNEQLNINIFNLFSLLTDHLIQQSAIRLIEYLIQMFKINTMNSDDLFMMLLPYHQNQIFDQIIKTINLDSVILNKTVDGLFPIVSQKLRKFCIIEPSFLNIICKELSEQAQILTNASLKGPFISQVKISFLTALLSDVITQAERINDNILRNILQPISECLKSVRNYALREQKSNSMDQISKQQIPSEQVIIVCESALILITQIASKIKLSINTTHALLIEIGQTLISLSNHSDKIIQQREEQSRIKNEKKVEKFNLLNKLKERLDLIEEGEDNDEDDDEDEDDQYTLNQYKPILTQNLAQNILLTSACLVENQPDILIGSEIDKNTSTNLNLTNEEQKSNQQNNNNNLIPSAHKFYDDVKRLPQDIAKPFLNVKYFFIPLEQNKYDREFTLTNGNKQTQAASNLAFARIADHKKEQNIRPQLPIVLQVAHSHVGSHRFICSLFSSILYNYPNTKELLQQFCFGRVSKVMNLDNKMQQSNLDEYQFQFNQSLSGDCINTINKINEIIKEFENQSQINIKIQNIQKIDNKQSFNKEQLQNQYQLQNIEDNKIINQINNANINEKRKSKKEKKKKKEQLDLIQQTTQIGGKIDSLIQMQSLWDDQERNDIMNILRNEINFKYSQFNSSFQDNIGNGRENVGLLTQDQQQNILISSFETIQSLLSKFINSQSNNTFIKDDLNINADNKDKQFNNSSSNFNKLKKKYLKLWSKQFISLIGNKQNKEMESFEMKNEREKIISYGREQLPLLLSSLIRLLSNSDKKIRKYAVNSLIPVLKILCIEENNNLQQQQSSLQFSSSSSSQQENCDINLNRKNIGNFFAQMMKPLVSLLEENYQIFINDSIHIIHIISQILQSFVSEQKKDSKMDGRNKSFINTQGVINALHLILAYSADEISHILDNIQSSNTENTSPSHSSQFSHTIHAISQISTQFNINNGQQSEYNDYSLHSNVKSLIFSIDQLNSSYFLSSSNSATFKSLSFSFSQSILRLTHLTYILNKSILYINQVQIKSLYIYEKKDIENNNNNIQEQDIEEDQINKNIEMDKHQNHDQNSCSYSYIEAFLIPLCIISKRLQILLFQSLPIIQQSQNINKLKRIQLNKENINNSKENEIIFEEQPSNYIRELFVKWNNDDNQVNNNHYVKQKDIITFSNNSKLYLSFTIESFDAVILTFTLSRLIQNICSTYISQSHINLQAKINTDQLSLQLTNPITNIIESFLQWSEFVLNSQINGNDINQHSIISYFDDNDILSNTNQFIFSSNFSKIFTSIASIGMLSSLTMLPAVFPSINIEKKISLLQLLLSFQSSSHQSQQLDNKQIQIHSPLNIYIPNVASYGTIILQQLPLTVNLISAILIVPQLNEQQIDASRNINTMNKQRDIEDGIQYYRLNEPFPESIDLSPHRIPLLCILLQHLSNSNQLTYNSHLLLPTIFYTLKYVCSQRYYDQFVNYLKNRQIKVNLEENENANEENNQEGKDILEDKEQNKYQIQSGKSKLKKSFFTFNESFNQFNIFTSSSIQTSSQTQQEQSNTTKDNDNNLSFISLINRFIQLLIQTQQVIINQIILLNPEDLHQISDYSADFIIFYSFFTQFSIKRLSQYSQQNINPIKHEQQQRLKNEKIQRIQIQRNLKKQTQLNNSSHQTLVLSLILSTSILQLSPFIIQRVYSPLLTLSIQCLSDECANSQINQINSKSQQPISSQSQSQSIQLDSPIIALLEIVRNIINSFIKSSILVLFERKKQQINKYGIKRIGNEIDQILDNEIIKSKLIQTLEAPGLHTLFDILSQSITILPSQLYITLFKISIKASVEQILKIQQTELLTEYELEGDILALVVLTLLFRHIAYFNEEEKQNNFPNSQSNQFDSKKLKKNKISSSAASDSDINNIFPTLCHNIALQFDIKSQIQMGIVILKQILQMSIISIQQIFYNHQLNLKKKLNEQQFEVEFRIRADTFNQNNIPIEKDAEDNQEQKDNQRFNQRSSQFNLSEGIDNKVPNISNIPLLNSVNYEHQLSSIPRYEDGLYLPHLNTVTLKQLPQHLLQSSNNFHSPKITSNIDLNNNSNSFYCLPEQFQLFMNIASETVELFAQKQRQQLIEQEKEQFNQSNILQDAINVLMSFYLPINILPLLNILTKFLQNHFTHFPSIHQQAKKSNDHNESNSLSSTQKLCSQFASQSIILSSALRYASINKKDNQYIADLFNQQQYINLLNILKLSSFDLMKLGQVISEMMFNGIKTHIDCAEQVCFVVIQREQEFQTKTDFKWNDLFGNTFVKLYPQSMINNDITNQSPSQIDIQQSILPESYILPHAGRNACSASIHILLQKLTTVQGRNELIQLNNNNMNDDKKIKSNKQQFYLQRMKLRQGKKRKEQFDNKDTDVSDEIEELSNNNNEKECEYQNVNIENNESKQSFPNRLLKILINILLIPKYYQQQVQQPLIPSKVTNHNLLANIILSSPNSSSSFFSPIIDSLSISISLIGEKFPQEIMKSLSAIITLFKITEKLHRNNQNEQFIISLQDMSGIVQIDSACARLIICSLKHFNEQNKIENRLRKLILQLISIILEAINFYKRFIHIYKQCDENESNQYEREKIELESLSINALQPLILSLSSICNHYSILEQSINRGMDKDEDDEDESTEMMESNNIIQDENVLKILIIQLSSPLLCYQFISEQGLLMLPHLHSRFCFPKYFGDYSNKQDYYQNGNFNSNNQFTNHSFSNEKTNNAKQMHRKRRKKEKKLIKNNLQVNSIPQQQSLSVKQQALKQDLPNQRIKIGFQSLSLLSFLAERCEVNKYADIVIQILQSNLSDNALRVKEKDYNPNFSYIHSIVTQFSILLCLMTTSLSSKSFNEIQERDVEQVQNLLLNSALQYISFLHQQWRLFYINQIKERNNNNQILTFSLPDSICMTQAIRHIDLRYSQLFTTLCTKLSEEKMQSLYSSLLVWIHENPQFTKVSLSSLSEDSSAVKEINNLTINQEPIIKLSTGAVYIHRITLLFTLVQSLFSALGNFAVFTLQSLEPHIISFLKFNPNPLLEYQDENTDNQLKNKNKKKENKNIVKQNKHLLFEDNQRLEITHTSALTPSEFIGEMFIGQNGVYTQALGALLLCLKQIGHLEEEKGLKLMDEEKRQKIAESVSLVFGLCQSESNNEIEIEKKMKDEIERQNIMKQEEGNDVGINNRKRRRIDDEEQANKELNVDEEVENNKQKNKQSSIISQLGMNIYNNSENNNKIKILWESLKYEWSIRIWSKTWKWRRLQYLINNRSDQIEKDQQQENEKDQNINEDENEQIEMKKEKRNRQNQDELFNIYNLNLQPTISSLNFVAPKLFSFLLSMLHPLELCHISPTFSTEIDLGSFAHKKSDKENHTKKTKNKIKIEDEDNYKDHSAPDQISMFGAFFNLYINYHNVKSIARQDYLQTDESFNRFIRAIKMLVDYTTSASITAVSDAAACVTVTSTISSQYTLASFVESEISAASIVPHLHRHPLALLTAKTLAFIIGKQMMPGQSLGMFMPSSINQISLSTTEEQRQKDFASQLWRRISRLILNEIAQTRITSLSRLNSDFIDSSVNNTTQDIKEHIVRANVQQACICGISEMYIHIGTAFLTSTLSEQIPALADLLMSDNLEVISAARTLKQIMEQLSGEKLDDYIRQ